jgi:hypothetical protein
MVKMFIRKKRQALVTTGLDIMSRIEFGLSRLVVDVSENLGLSNLLFFFE